MKDTIFKLTDDITAEELISVFKLEDMEDYADVIDLDTFEEYNDSGCIIDYDGSGYIVYGKKIVRNSTIWCFNKSVLVADKYIVPYDSFRELFGKKIKVAWFNK